MSITNQNNYFEDFEINTKFIHNRGRTVTEMDNHLVTLMTLNTAQSHFNVECMRDYLDGSIPERLVMGGLTMSIAVGLTSEDISENAIMDLGFSDIRNASPVFHGDTITAESTIIDKKDSEERPDAGIITVLTVAYNQKKQKVWEGKRSILIKKKEYWLDKDNRFYQFL